MKKIIVLLLALLLLFGCTIKEKTAEKHGEGISVEIGNIDNISFVSIRIYAEGLPFGDYFTYKEEGTFQPGEIVWFDAAVFPSDNFQEIEVIYSRNPDGSDSATTNMIDITKAKEWVNTKLNNEMQLELSEYK